MSRIGPLDGIKVLDLTAVVVGPTCTLMLAEQGAITVTCEFCQKPYRFDVIDVEQLFAPVPLPTAGQSLN